ncbi:MAG: hypothetical protein J6A89_05660 [Clostridia bacterium]|nr:hypothetical protein [Clostridia bacterium]
MEKTLTYEQFIQKLYEILGEKINHYQFETRENLYKSYLKSPKSSNLFEDRDIDLTNEPKIIMDGNSNGSFCYFWFMLSDFKKYLLKRAVPSRLVQTTKNSSVIGNSMVLPKIVRALNCESAEYYTTFFYEDDDSGSMDKETFLVTPSFLGEGEEIINFSQIAGNELEITKIEQELKRYLELRKYSQSQIDGVIKQFIKTTFISKFLENTDESPDNLSIIIGANKSIRMSPMYDYDYYCGCKRKAYIERTVNGKTNLESFINYYKERPWFESWLETKVSKLNVDNVLKETVKSPNKGSYDSQYYKDFIGKRKQIVRDSLSQDRGEEMNKI